MGVRAEGRRIDKAIAAKRRRVKVFLLGGGGDCADLRADVQGLLSDYEIVVMEEEPDEPNGDPFKKFLRILAVHKPTHFFFVFLNDESPNPGAQIEVMGLYNHVGSDAARLTAATVIFAEEGWPRRGLSNYTKWFLGRVRIVEFSRQDHVNPLEELVAGQIDAIAYEL